jgi:hypothetical protein
MIFRSTRVDDICEVSFESVFGAGIDEVDRRIGTSVCAQRFINVWVGLLTSLRIPMQTSMPSEFCLHLPVQTKP